MIPIAYFTIKCISFYLHISIWMKIICFVALPSIEVSSAMEEGSGSPDFLVKINIVFMGSATHLTSIC